MPYANKYVLNAIASVHIHVYIYMYIYICTCFNMLTTRSIDTSRLCSKMELLLYQNTLLLLASTSMGERTFTRCTPPTLLPDTPEPSRCPPEGPTVNISPGGEGDEVEKLYIYNRENGPLSTEFTARTCTIKYHLVNTHIQTVYTS